VSIGAGGPGLSSHTVKEAPDSLLSFGCAATVADIVDEIVAEVEADRQVPILPI
jgi:hypothetical protein